MQNRIDRPALTDAAHRVLERNNRGTFTTPSPLQYPHQWNWDAAFMALGWSHFDIARARTEIRSLLSAQWRNGMVPHILYHQGESDYFPPPAFWQMEGLAHTGPVLSSGLTQPPVLASVVRRLHDRFANDPAQVSFSREVLPKLVAWHRWLHTARDADGTGLPCLIHPWESGTDNSPRWLAVLDKLEPYDVPEFKRRDMQHVSPEERPRPEDYERFVFLMDRGRRVGWQDERIIEAHPFLVQDAMFCAILHQADQDLLALARALDFETAELERWIARTDSVFDQRFWNDERGLYLDYDVRAGAPIPVNTFATFVPLYAGLASAGNAARLIAEHYNNPQEYAPDARTRYRVLSTAKNEPAFAPRRYWCGPVWMIANWLLIHGLSRYGMPALAQELHSRTLELLETQGLREYYDPRDGTGLGGQDFAWTAGIALDLMDLGFGQPDV